MSFRQIIVQVDESQASGLRAKAAADLAQRHGAQLTGVFLTSEYVRQYMAAESLTALPADVVQRVLSGHDEAVAKIAGEAKAQFEAACAESGVEHGWRMAGGDSPQAFLAVARRSDLTIFPRQAKACLSEHGLSAAQVTLASGGPVLIMPDDDYAPPVGRRVLVAWNGGREAARALQDAWPILEQAETIHVLTVSPDGEGGPDGQLQSLLAKHGVKAQLIVDPSQDESAVEVIERQVAELGADLLVMGLYGRPRLQELLLGGVSRRMVAASPIPIFASH
ncbi:MAG: universal stress protein [Phenylobacterium sp.]|uniref:universal stress protein n=1 Tax=Phenylobacterium sp. TaxID=1871053 RepID=UPI00271A65CA|nr:universal stress protein [Phenylobacterium sp.]MDO8901551.1 universal stress protein [Phenylobacterium sp.]